jgi:putative flippase GtrA
MREVLALGRFGLVGIAATLIHVTAAGLLIKQANAPALAANAFAFCCAFLVSFTGHYFWSFSKPGLWRRALWRFFLIAAGGFILNNVLLLSLLETGWFSPLVSTVTSIFIIPLFSFLGSRYWGFRRSHPEQHG